MTSGRLRTALTLITAVAVSSGLSSGCFGSPEESEAADAPGRSVLDSIDDMPTTAETTATPASGTTSPATADEVTATTGSIPATNMPAMTSVPPFTGDPDSEWCGVAAELVALSDKFEAAPVNDPLEVERTFTAFVDRMALIVFVAPSEIVDDVAISVAAFAEVRELLEAADFDLSAVDMSSIEPKIAEIANASNRVATYNREVCQLNAGPPSSSAPDGAPSSSTPTPDAARQAALALLVDGGYTAAEAECIVDGIQKGEPTDAVLSACDVSLDGGG